MTQKPKPKPDDPAQSKRFVEIAKEHEADDADALERALKKVAIRNNKKPSKRH